MPGRLHPREPDDPFDDELYSSWAIPGGRARRQPPVLRRRDRGRMGDAFGDEALAEARTFTRHAPPRREPARRAKKRDRHYTDSSGASAGRAATVACGVNAPEERPSVSAATSDWHSAPPSSTAR